MKRKGILIKEGFVDHLWKLGDRDEKLKDDIVKIKAGKEGIGMSGLSQKAIKKVCKERKMKPIKCVVCRRERMKRGIVKEDGFIMEWNSYFVIKGYHHDYENAIAVCPHCRDFPLKEILKRVIEDMINEKEKI